MSEIDDLRIVPVTCSLRAWHAGARKTRGRTASMQHDSAVDIYIYFFYSNSVFRSMARSSEKW